MAGVAAGALFLVAAVVALLFIVGARGFDTSRAGSVFDDVKGFFAIGDGGRERRPAQGVLGATRRQARPTGEGASLRQLIAAAPGGTEGGVSLRPGRGSDRSYADLVERLLALLRADDEEFAAALERLRALLRGAPNHRVKQLDRAIRRRVRQLARRGETDGERLELTRLDAVASVVREEIERRGLTRERRVTVAGEGTTGGRSGPVGDATGEGPDDGSPKARRRSGSSPREGKDDDRPEKDSKGGEKRDAGTRGGAESGDDDGGEGEGKKKGGEGSKSEDGDRDGSSREEPEAEDRDDSNEDEREEEEREEEEREEPEREDEP